LKISLYIFVEAKCGRNWENETHRWAQYPVRDKKMAIFGVYRPYSRDMRKTVGTLAYSSSPATAWRGLVQQADQ
jgi:hypothetical protein